MVEGHHSLWRRAVAIQGCPGDALPLCLMLQPKFSLGPGLCASKPWSVIGEASTWAAEILQCTATLRRAVQRRIATPKRCSGHCLRSACGGLQPPQKGWIPLCRGWLPPKSRGITGQGDKMFRYASGHSLWSACGG